MFLCFRKFYEYWREFYIRQHMFYRVWFSTWAFWWRFLFQCEIVSYFGVASAESAGLFSSNLIGIWLSFFWDGLYLMEIVVDISVTKFLPFPCHSFGVFQVLC